MFQLRTGTVVTGKPNQLGYSGQSLSVIQRQVGKSNNLSLKEQKVDYQRKRKRSVASLQTSTSSSPSPSIIQESQDVLPQTDYNLFQWTKQWYPIHGVMHLDVNRPTSVQLLGKDLVVWRDGEGEWVCFEDQCPHRLVPLSEGRLETDGTLQCAYHAWRFNAKGECVKIPQAESEMEQKLCENQRACAKVYPTQEKYGLLWIWGECGADASLECLLKEPDVPDTLKSLDVEHKDWLIRDMPYSHEILLENVLDPAHVTVAHHGRGGADRNKAKPLFTKLEAPIHAQKGFKFYKSEVTKNITQKNMETAGYVQFMPPSIVEYYSPVGELRNFASSMVLISTPTTKGQCRLFQIVFFLGEEGQKISKKIKKIPKWLFHLGANIFFQQDNTFLFKQEKIIQKKSLSNPIPKSYYTPTVSDLGVNEFHKWLTRHAQNGVTYVPEMVPKEYTENDLLDTYNQHTKICTFCSGALANFKKIQIVAWVACAVCAICMICSAFVAPPMSVNVFKLVVQLPALKVLAFSIFSLIFGAIGIYANKTIPTFYKTEYSHADH